MQRLERKVEEHIGGITMRPTGAISLAAWETRMGPRSCGGEEKEIKVNRKTGADCEGLIPF